MDEDRQDFIDRVTDLQENFFTCEGYEVKPICAYWFGSEATVMYDNGESFQLTWGARP